MARAWVARPASPEGRDTAGSAMARARVHSEAPQASGDASRQFAAVSFGEHGGQHQLRRGAGRGRWGDARHHVTGDPVCHLLAQLAIELRCAGEELARDLGLAGVEPRQLQRRRPPCQRRRHRRRRAQSRPAFTDYDCAGEDVADALGLRRQHAADDGGAAREHPDLHHRRQRAKQRLPEAFRAAVVGHHAQAHRDLAHRPSPRGGFERQRIPDNHQHREDDQDGGAQRGRRTGSGWPPTASGRAGSRQRSP